MENNEKLLTESTDLGNETGSIITADTVVSGDIISTSPLKINGEVKGNVQSGKTIVIRGRVIGDINGENISLESGYVKGNIVSKAKVEIGKNVEVFGDIQAEDLVASGKIKGEIVVKNLTTLENNAICEGSITASLINIKTGAKINGPLMICEGDKPPVKSKVKEPAKETEKPEVKVEGQPNNNNNLNRL